MLASSELNIKEGLKIILIGSHCFIDEKYPIRFGLYFMVDNVKTYCSNIKVKIFGHCSFGISWDEKWGKGNHE